MANSDEDGDGEDVICKGCSKEVKENEAGIFCDGVCQSWYHRACVGVSAQQYKKINEEILKMLIWMCDPCRSKLKLIMKKQKSEDTLRELVSKMSTMDKKINDMCEKMDNRMESINQTSYASVLANKSRLDKTNKSCVSHEKTLIIKPKKNQNKDACVKEVKQKLNPAAIGAPIKFFSTTSTGCVVIKSDNVNNLEKLNDQARTMLSESYNIELKEQFNPRLKIIGLPKEYKDGKELMYDLKLLNSKIIFDTDQLKITYTYQSKKSKKWNVYVETTGETFRRLVNTNLDLGWSSCKVLEDLNIKKCFNCGSFGHKESQCNSVKICTYCATDGHDRFNCNRHQKKCVNCQYANNKYNSTYKTDHDSEDERECAILAKRCRLARERINYDTLNKDFVLL